jgi:glycosyltransferase involved in cell wall biosynthesis
MLALRLACETGGLDLDDPVGPAVYARFVRDLLLSHPDVEPAQIRDADAILSLDGRFRAGRGQRTVTAVHDLAHLLARGALSRREWLRQNWQVASAVRRSDHLLVPSTAVRLGLVERLRVAEERITVLAPLPPSTVRRAKPAEVRALKEDLDLPERYFLFLGTGSRRKNLGLLARAWEAARPDLPESVGLVLAGRGATGVPGARELGYVASDRLPPLLSGAIAWLNPSLYEGCAIGPLEAMACGAPPVVAATGAQPRAVDRAGLVLDAHDPAPWAEAMTALAGSPDFRTSLANACLKAIAEAREHPPDPGPLLEQLGARHAAPAAPA